MTNTAVEHIEIAPIILSIALIWGLSKLLNSYLIRFKLPGVLGELFTGLLLGLILLIFPASVDNVRSSFGFEIGNFIDSMRTSHALQILGELGILLLLFEVGLETELDEIKAVGKEALLVALGGVVAPFLCAWGFNFAFHLNWSVELILFVGLVLAATSIGVTARVFQDLKALNSLNAQIILGAAVLDDILGLLLLSIISAFVTLGSDSLSMSSIGFIVLKAALFLGSSIWVGHNVTGKFIPWISKIGRSDSLGFLIWILTYCFALSYIASLMGLAPIIGAFAAGITLDKVRIKDLFGETHSIEDYIAPIRAILAPIFFVKIGLAIDLHTILGWFPFALTVIACFSKLVSGWIFVPFKTKMNRLIVGVGMMPRGEVGLVVAAIGSQIGLLNNNLYSALLIAVIATTFIAPIWLQLLVKKED
jgi:Kef-type K+ transport system membrane component KefB